MENVRLHIDSRGIATLTLNRPDRHNAFDDVVIAELQRAFERLHRDQQVRVVMLKAVGKSFSAGADLAWMRRTAHYTEEENLEEALKMATCFHTLAALDKPTIALVQGPAYGGGVGLIAACDIAIGAAEATFCFPEVKLGLIPAVISPFINQAMGKRTARRYFLTGEIFTAEEACRYGLIHCVVEKPDLDEKGAYFCSSLLRNSPSAMAAIKARPAAYPASSGKETLLTTARWIAEARSTEEGKEGVAAFLEKRKPSWINQ